ncbi:ML domain-containing protein [Streptomyces liangshanensis]|uniref:MD-2-related lipid-recognition domain-containing protein n=1 Tax=Streptomyces liangshanensis TaxID=2717324 RepID=A0A6G9GW75_9ACTN|nr:ML domain-containing protein [Streptomyces liangshanensis]QIQ02326.1 hypothetical protein HA039_08405 [Streptomyces liangshanensis]
MQTTSTGGSQWNDSGSSNSNFKVTDVSLTPDPPVRGKSVTVTADGALTSDISGGQVAVTVKYGIIPVLKSTSTLSAAPAGAYSSAVAFELPDDSPAGPYAAQFSFSDQDGVEIAGFFVTFKA